MERWATRVQVLTLGVGLLCLPDEASAFCRSTTCKGESCPRDAETGCKREGKPLFWASSCVGYSIESHGSLQIPIELSESIVVNSFAAWSGVRCGEAERTPSLRVTREEDSACQQVEFNPHERNANVILFQDNGWAYVQPEFTLGKTTVSFNGDTGEIIDADIEINTFHNTFGLDGDPAFNDLQATITHEVGHFFGIDHSKVNEATMYFSYNKGELFQRDLHADDVAAYCDAYPHDRRDEGGKQLTCDPKPRNGFSVDCQQALRAPVPGEKPQPAKCSLIGPHGPNSGSGRVDPMALSALLLGAACLRRVRKSHREAARLR